MVLHTLQRIEIEDRIKAGKAGRLIVTNLFTQAVKLNWNFKIGAEVNQVKVLVDVEIEEIVVEKAGVSYR